MDCHYCGQTFSRKYTLIRHEERCDRNPNRIMEHYECNYCGKEFHRKDVLLKHLKNIHTTNSKTINNHDKHYTINIGGSVNIDGPIYLARDPGFLEKLIKLKGGEEGALNAIKEAIYNKVKGEVKLFGEMYLQGDDPTRWPIMCVDEKTHFFKIRQSDGTWLSDPDAVESRRRFYGNYTDSVLILMNQFMFLPVVDHEVDHEDFSDRAGEKMDYVDLKTIQARLTEICSQKFDQELFAKELTKLYFKRIRDIQNAKRDNTELIRNIETLMNV